MVHELRPPAPATVEVLVLARDVPAGAELGPGDLRTEALPRGLAAPRMLRSPPDVVGERLAVGLPAGFPLAPEVLVGTGLAAGAAPGEVVVPVRLADPAVVDALRPGDRVDLLATSADAAATTGGAHVVAAGALVLARDDGAGGGLLGTGEPTSLVFVAVPRGVVPDVVGASAWSPLRVVLTN